MGAPAASVCAGGKVYSGGTQLGVGGGFVSHHLLRQSQFVSCGLPGDFGLPLAIGPDTTTGNYSGALDDSRRHS